MKVENSISEKRITKKKERIGNLEKRISELREQNNHFKIELEKLKTKVVLDSGRKTMTNNVNVNGNGTINEEEEGLGKLRPSDQPSNEHMRLERNSMSKFGNM